MLFLAITLAGNAFKDYHSYKKIFAILPLEPRMPYELEFKKEILKVSFLEVPLHSPKGCSVLRNIINLCQEDP